MSLPVGLLAPLPLRLLPHSAASASSGLGAGCVKPGGEHKAGAEAAEQIPNEDPLTLTGLTSGALAHVLLQLDEPKDLGRVACVSLLLNQAVAPLAPALFHFAVEGVADRVRALLSEPFDRAGLTAVHPAARHMVSPGADCPHPIPPL